MSAYLIATLKITDRDRYASYEAGFMDIFNRFNGRLLSVDENVEPLEGDWGYTRTVLVEFPTKDDALAWFQSDDYQALADHRKAASTGSIVMLQGLDG